MDMFLRLIGGGAGNLAAYLAAHVLLCLLPAFFIAGAMAALIPKASLTRWLVDFNWGEDVPAPGWTIDLAPELDLESEVKIDRQLLQMGVTLPEGYFYEKYGRPAPISGGRRLQYDDSNLYQYHLQFGILTVNEVRAKLGLPPVPWGDHPTSPAANSVHPPTPGVAAGEDQNANDNNVDTEIKDLKRSEK